jgi:hypothetical protein
VSNPLRHRESTAFSYRYKSVGAKEIGKELGVPSPFAIMGARNVRA